MEHTILIIDDNKTNIELMEARLQGTQYKTLIAYDGNSGLELLKKNTDIVDVILLDRMMPNLDGISLLKKIKQDKKLENIPVIMQTAAAEKSQIVEGIQAGVYYYLTKPFGKDLLISIVDAAIRDYMHKKELIMMVNQQKELLNSIQKFEMHCVNIGLKDAQTISNFFAAMYPEPQVIISGISEMLLNAIEHGNLNITYEEKTLFINNGTWQDEITKRQGLEEYRNKKTIISFERTATQYILEIADEGHGFDWQQYMQLTPERATDNHGRGIAMSKLFSFDAIEYLGNGNRVRCYKNITV